MLRLDNQYLIFPQSAPKSIKGLSKKEGAKRKINMSGYILFSSEMRAVIKAQHPDFSFGELSRLVGTEWRNLEATKKAEYEGKVSKFAILHKRNWPGNHIWTLMHVIQCLQVLHETSNCFYLLSSIQSGQLR